MMSKNSLCESCRDLKMSADETFAEFIDECLAHRGGAFTNPMDKMMVCGMVKRSLESKGGCAMCIEYWGKEAEF